MLNQRLGGKKAKDSQKYPLILPLVVKMASAREEAPVEVTREARRVIRD